MARNTPLISIVIVNHNGVRFFKKLFASVAKQTYPNLEVVVVDSGSTDESIQILSQRKGIRLYCTANSGYAAACNVGVNKAKGDYVMIMNTDVWFDASFVADLFKEMHLRHLRVIAPQERSYEGTRTAQWESCTIDPLGYPVFLSGTAAQNHRSFYLSGLCFLVSKKLYRATGGLDAHFFMYFEETDWFWRLNLLNVPFAYSTKVLIHHFTAGHTTITPRYSLFLWRNQNCLQMLLKNYAWYTLLLILPIYMAISFFEMLFFLLTDRGAIAYSYLQGLWFNIRHFKNIMEARAEVQKKRKITDWEIIHSHMYHGIGKLRHLWLYITQKNNGK